MKKLFLVLYMLAFTCSCVDAVDNFVPNLTKPDGGSVLPDKEELYQASKTIDELLLKIDAKYDSFEKLTVYTHKSQFEGLSLNAAQQPDGYSTLRMVIISFDDPSLYPVSLLCSAYAGEDWIFYNTLYLDADGVIKQFTVSPSRNIEIFGSTVLVFEEDCNSSSPTWLSNDATFWHLRDVALKDSRVRFSGDSNIDRDVLSYEAEIFDDMTQFFWHLEQEYLAL